MELFTLALQFSEEKIHTYFNLSCFQLMDSGDLLVLGLPVHKLVVVACKLEYDHVIAPHPPMVVQIVKEGKPDSVIVTPLHVLVRMQGKCCVLFDKLVFTC